MEDRTKFTDLSLKVFLVGLKIGHMQSLPIFLTKSPFACTKFNSVHGRIPEAKQIVKPEISILFQPDFEVYAAHYIWRRFQYSVHSDNFSNTTEHIIPLPLHIFSVGIHTCLVAQTFFGTLISDLIPIFFCIGCVSR
jgi:hypothetical protein